MPERIPQSVTKRVALKAYLSSDHLSDATSKTIAVTISKNGAAFGNPSAGATNATEIASGWYYVDLSTTDTGTTGPLIVRGTSSGVDNVESLFVVVDAHNAGFDGVPSVVAGASGGLPTGNASGQVTLTSAYDPAKTAAQAGDAMALTSGERTTLAGVIWAVLTSGLSTANSIGKLLVDNINATISSRSSHSAADVWAVGTRTLSAFSFAVDISAASVTAVWDKATSALTTSGSIGKWILDKLDVVVSTRSSHTAADVWTSGTRSLTSFGSLVADTAAAVWAAVSRTLTAFAFTPTLDSAYDPAKTAAQAGDAMALTSGERTTLTGVIWAALTSGLTTVGSIGKLLVDNVNATISSRSSHSAADVWAVGTRTLTGFGTLVSDIWAAVTDSAGVTTLLSRLTSGRAANLDNLDAAVSSRSTYAGADTSGTTTLLGRIASALTITVGKVDVNDKTGFALTSAYDPAKIASQAGDAMALTSGERTTLTAAIWAALTSALTTAGSIGKLIVDNLNATVSSRSTYSGGAVASVTAPVTVGTNNDKTGYSLSVTPPTAVQIRQEMDSNSTNWQISMPQ
jgi:hypothetical protein